MSDVMPPELARDSYRCFQRARESGEPQTFEYSLTVKGRERWYEARIVSTQDDNILSIVRDITDRRLAEDALRESEGRYRTIFETAGVSVWEEDFTELKALIDGLQAQGVTDLRSYLKENPSVVRLAVEMVKVNDVNQRTLKLYGARTKDELLKSLANIFVPETDQAFIEELVMLADGRRYFESETIVRTLQGELRHVLFTIAFPEREGVYDRVLVTVLDITERYRAEEALRESEGRFRNMADTAPVMIWMSGDDKLGTYFNRQWLEFTGRTLEQESGNGWAEGVHPDDCQRFSRTYNAAFDLGEPFRVEYRLRRRDGVFRWIYNTGVPRFSPGGKFRGYVGTCIDITERKATEEALTNLSGQLIRAREDECARIARELHDDVNQRMALVSIELEQLLQGLPGGESKLKSQLGDVMKQIREISREIHRMSYDLHPSKLVHLGLVPSLGSLCEELHQRHGLIIRFSHDETPAVLPRDVSLCLYRIVQECLHNVIRHSGAKEASLELRVTGPSIRVEVSDTGVGFDTESPRSKQGLGLVSMRERLRLVGGTISIESRPSKGTRIVARIPLERSNGVGQQQSPGDKTRAAGG
jgi:PAS domain S-box-containing protein